MLSSEERLNSPCAKSLLLPAHRLPPTAQAVTVHFDGQRPNRLMCQSFGARQRITPADIRSAPDPSNREPHTEQFHIQRSLHRIGGRRHLSAASAVRLRPFGAKHFLKRLSRHLQGSYWTFPTSCSVLSRRTRT